MTNIKSFICILLTIVFSVSTKVDAQIQSFGTIPDSLGTMYVSSKMSPSGELLITSNYSKKSIWKVNYATQDLTLLKTIDDWSNYSAPCLFTSKGVFQLAYTYAANGNDKQYRIHYVDSSGLSKVTSILYTTADQSPNTYVPMLLKVIDSTLYYVKGNSDGTHELMRYHEGLSAPQSVCMLISKPYYSTEYNGDLVVAVKTNQPDYHFVNCTMAGGPQVILTIPATSVQTTMGEMCKRGNETFLAIRYSGNRKEIWKTDFTADGTSVYIDSTSAEIMEFDGDDLYFYEIDFYFLNEIYKSTYSQPENTQIIPIDPELGPKSNVGRLNRTSFFQTYSYQKGIELAQLKNDSVLLIRDHFKGTQSGLCGVPESSQMQPSVFYAPADDTCYMSMTNGADSLVYLYSLKSGNFQSYFPLDNSTKIVKSTFLGNNFYWYKKTLEGIELKVRSLVTDLQPQPEPSVVSPSEFWHRDLIFPSSYASFFSNYNSDYNYIDGCRLLEDGSVIGCFMLRYFEGNTIISSDNTVNDSLNAAIILFRYDTQGNLLWSKSLGDRYTIFLHSPVYDTDSEGNILLAGMFENKAYFGEDSLQASNIGNFLTKIDGNTGEIIWKKQISEAPYSNSVEIEQLVIDEQDNIHLSVLYRHFSCNLDGMYQSADRSPVNAVAVFDPSGTIQSFENTPTIWTDNYGETHVFDYDITTHQLFAGQSQGYYNWWSSCEYNDWGYAFQITDQEGVRNQSMYVTSTDLGSVTTGFANNGQLIAYGYFRGTMNAENFQATSPMGNNCHKNAGFQMVYSPEVNHMLAMQLSTEPFFPLDSKHFGEYHYVYGSDANGELVIIKQHSNGEEAGYKRLGQYCDPFEFGDDQFFDVNDTALVFLGDHFSKNATYGITADYSYNCYKSILKTPNANWQTDKKWFEPVAITIPENTFTEDLIVSPNPFTDGVEVLFKGTKAGFDTYELIDLNGKRIANGSLNDSITQELSFGEIRSGAYFLRFNSPEKTVQVKIVRL